MIHLNKKSTEPNQHISNEIVHGDNIQNAGFQDFGLNSIVLVNNAL